MSIAHGATKGHMDTQSRVQLMAMLAPKGLAATGAMLSEWHALSSGAKVSSGPGLLLSHVWVCGPRFMLGSMALGSTKSHTDA